MDDPYIRQDHPVCTLLRNLFVKKPGLRRGGGGRLAAGDTDYAEHGEFGNGGAGDVDAVGVGAEVGRSEVEAVVEEGEEVVRDDPFQGGLVTEAHLDPEAVELGAAEEGLAFEGEALFKIADEVDGANFGEGDLLVLAVLSKEVERFGTGKTAGVEIAAQGGLVAEFDDDFLVRRGWGSRFQTKSPNWGRK